MMLVLAYVTTMLVPFSRAVESNGTLAKEGEADDDSRTIVCSSTSIVHDARLDRQ
jgi:hypothetical protein